MADICYVLRPIDDVHFILNLTTHFFFNLDGQNYGRKNSLDM